MRRLIRSVAAVVAVAAFVIGCGGEGPSQPDSRFADQPATSPAENPGDAPAMAPVTLTAFEGLLEAAGLNLVRTGANDELGPTTDVPFLATAREENARTSLEFDVWIFGDPRTAVRGLRDLADSEQARDGAIARGRNVVVIFPERTTGTALERRVRAVLRELEAAG